MNLLKFTSTNFLSNNGIKKDALGRKISLLTLLVLVLCFYKPVLSNAQDFKRTITKSASFSDHSAPDNKFKLMNINGSVTIEAYKGDSIELTVEEQIQGSDSEIEQANHELEYKLKRRGNLILGYLDAPFVTIKFKDGKVHYNVNRNDDDYQFIHEVHVKVPKNILLEASTVNKGEVRITGDFKKVEASNVNGPLNLKHLTSQTIATTVNGDISTSYDKAPDTDCKFQTVNGTIEVFMPENLSADIFFESMHGDLYTDFENVSRLKPEVKKQQHSTHSKVTYRVDKFSPLRIGNGGPKLSFEVLNGDVYIRQQ
jgi:hypothetical protein